MPSNFKQLSALENLKEKISSKYPIEKLHEIGFHRIVVSQIIFELENVKQFFYRISVSFIISFLHH